MLQKLYQSIKGPLRGGNGPLLKKQQSVWILVDREEVHAIHDRLAFGAHAEADEVIC